MFVLYCSKHAGLNFDCHKQCKDMCTARGSVQDPGRNPRHPQTSKLTYFRTLQSSYTAPGKAARLAFVSGNVDSWGAGPGLHALIHIHQAEAGLLAWPQNYILRMRTQATKHGVAFCIGLAAKLLRMRSKATKDNFAIRIGSATKLVRKCSKE